MFNQTKFTIGLIEFLEAHIPDNADAISIEDLEFLTTQFRIAADSMVELAAAKKVVDLIDKSESTHHIDKKSLQKSITKFRTN